MKIFRLIFQPVYKEQDRIQHSGSNRGDRVDLYYRIGCPFCTEVIQQDVPTLKEKYDKDSLEITLIETPWLMDTPIASINGQFMDDVPSVYNIEQYLASSKKVYIKKFVANE